METDNYILNVLQRTDPAKLPDLTLNLVSLDIKLAEKCKTLLDRKLLDQKVRSIGGVRVNLYDPLMFLLGMMPDIEFLVDEGQVHYCDTNYFHEGAVREDGGIHPPKCPCDHDAIWDLQP